TSPPLPYTTLFPSRNLSRETLSNIGQHPLHLGFETPVQNHVPQPDHHAGHDLPVDDLLDVDRPSHVRREDRVQPFALRLGERKRNGDFDRLGLELRSWPSDLPISSMSSSIRCAWMDCATGAVKTRPRMSDARSTAFSSISETRLTRIRSRLA